MLKNFSEIIKKVIKKKNPTVFDIGANKGQSIDFYKKLYPGSFIHSFEPNKFLFAELNLKYLKQKNVILNNLGCGEKITEKTFYIRKGSAHSSYLKLRKNSKWLFERSRYWNTTNKKFTLKKIKSKMTTIDHYCKKNSINFIDILKIDTEGYEENVLAGAKKTIKENKINLILVEIGLHDYFSKSSSFFQIERHLHNNNFCILGLETGKKLITRFNTDFGCDAVYVNSRIFDVKKIKN